jgi:cytoskeletal protein RodZ
MKSLFAEWMKVIIHPLGLAGFALFVVFLLLTKRNSSRQPGWSKVLFIVMAFVTLVGALFLAHEQIPRQTPVPSESTTEKRSSVGEKTQSDASAVKTEQITKGAASPAVAGVEGDVTITIGQPSGGK